MNINENLFQDSSIQLEERHSDKEVILMVASFPFCPFQISLRSTASTENQMVSFSNTSHQLFFSPSFNSIDLFDGIFDSQFTTRKNTSDEKIDYKHKVTSSNITRMHFLNETLKHRLAYTWSFWFYKKNLKCAFKDNLVFIASVDSVEDFWKVFNDIKPIEELSDGCDYMLFKKDLRPMWEHEKNRNGVRLTFNIEKKNSSTCLGFLWLKNLLSLIVDNSNYGKELEHINGTSISIREKTNRLALWIEETRAFKSRIQNIRRSFEHNLLIPTSEPIRLNKNSYYRLN
jgi:translation initiation factor 4E